MVTLYGFIEGLLNVLIVLVAHIGHFLLSQDLVMHRRKFAFECVLFCARPLEVIGGVEVRS